MTDDERDYAEERYNAGLLHPSDERPGIGRTALLAVLLWTAAIVSVVIAALRWT